MPMTKPKWLQYFFAP